MLYRHTHAHTHTRTHAHTHTQTRTHAHTHSHRKNARTHARTHSRTHARAHARTHTRTPWPGSPSTCGYADGRIVQIYVSITNTEGVMAIQRFLEVAAATLDFKKMQQDEIVHTLRKLLSYTIM